MLSDSDSAVAMTLKVAIGMQVNQEVSIEVTDEVSERQQTLSLKVTLPPFSTTTTAQ